MPNARPTGVPARTCSASASAKADAPPAPCRSSAGAGASADPASVSVVGPRMGHSGSSPGNSSSRRVIVPGPTSPNCVKPRFSFALKSRTAAAVFAP